MGGPTDRAAQPHPGARPPWRALPGGSRAGYERPPGDAARGILFAALLSSLFWMGLAWLL